VEISRILLAENLDLKDYIKDNDIETSGYTYVDLDGLYSSFAADSEVDQNEDG